MPQVVAGKALAASSCVFRYPPLSKTKAADQMRSAAFFVGFSVLLAGLRKFNQICPLRDKVWQVTASKRLTEFYRPLSSLAVCAPSSAGSNPNREASGLNPNDKPSATPFWPGGLCLNHAVKQCLSSDWRDKKPADREQGQSGNRAGFCRGQPLAGWCSFGALSDRLFE